MSDDGLQLAKRAGTGDAAALEALYRRYVDRVWRYGYLRTRSRDAAAEIVQETFVRVARGVRGFEGRSSVGTWIYAVARSAAIEYARREKREQAAREGVILRLRLGDGTAGRDVDVGSTECESSRAGRVGQSPTPGRDGAPGQRDRVREAIGRLSASQRDALVLCEIVDMSIRETAEVLGWGESRVKVTLHRARIRLRELLTDEGWNAADVRG